MGPITVGQVILNQFRVDQYIASGGMSSVFRVWDLKRNVYLAMKVLSTDLAEDPSMLKRFRREARAMQKLNHPNIVPFYGLYDTEDIYFLLEAFVDGPNLKEILKQSPNQSLSIKDTLIFTKAICAALGYAHANGVVHCDIKPGNVMVDQGGNIYLADFGIARHTDSSTTTMAGAGTAAYMAPEQIRNEPVTPETDIYALGIMVFEMLAGRRPFIGDRIDSESKSDTFAERLRFAHLKLTPPKLTDLRPDLPESISQVIQKALNKAPEDRFSSTMEFMNALCLASGVDQDSIISRIDIKAIIPKGIEIVPPFVLPAEEIQERKRSDFAQLMKRYFWIPAGIIFLFALGFFIPGLTGGSEGKKAVVPTLSTPLATHAQANTSTPTTIPSPTVTATPTNTPTPTPFPYETQINSIDGATMVLIPAGEFIMGAFDNESPFGFWGAEAPRHRVYLDSFWMYKTEVTNSMYALCVEVKACPKPEQTSTDRYPEYYTDSFYSSYPVVNVTWTGAQSYCVWAKGRLPTEAEWEKTARGDDQRWFPWGNDPPGNNRANYCDVNCVDTQYYDSSKDDGFSEAAPVGNYPEGASYYGILDMAGNVWEWTHDWFNAGYYQSSSESNPPGPAGGTTRVARGGSWYNPIDGIQTVVRNYYQPIRAYSTLGFRCVVEDNRTQ